MTTFKFIVIIVFLAVFGFSGCRGKTVVEKYPNGKIKSEETFVNNHKNGICKYYSEKGKLEMEMEYRNDTAVGIIKTFDENGIVSREVDLATHEGKVYRPDGKYCLKGKFGKDILMNGKWEDWSIDENFKRFEWTYVNDKENGAYTAFRKDGSIEAKGKYKNATLDDTLKYYGTDGVLEKIEIWQADKNGTSSSMISQTNFTDKKPDGATEVIDRKLYIWKNGKREFQLNIDSSIKNKTVKVIKD